MVQSVTLSGRNSGVECLLPKQDVVGSNPIARSIFFLHLSIALHSSNKKPYKEWPPLVGGFFIFKEGLYAKGT